MGIVCILGVQRSSRQGLWLSGGNKVMTWIWSTEKKCTCHTAKICQEDFAFPSCCTLLQGQDSVKQIEEDIAASFERAMQAGPMHMPQIRGILLFLLILDLQKFILVQQKFLWMWNDTILIFWFFLVYCILLVTIQIYSDISWNSRWNSSILKCHRCHSLSCQVLRKSLFESMSALKQTSAITETTVQELFHSTSSFLAWHEEFATCFLYLAAPQVLEQLTTSWTSLLHCLTLSSAASCIQVNFTSREVS